MNGIPAVLSMAVGAILSLAVDLVPKFKDWHAALEGYQKRWFTILLNLVVAIGLVGLACNEVAAKYLAKYLTLECSEAGALLVLESFLFQIGASQATFLLAPVNGKGKPKEGTT